MTANWESLYIQVGRLIETMPDLAFGPLTPDMQRWLGRAGALIEEAGDPADIALMKVATGGFGTSARHVNAQEITSILYRLLGKAELRAPTAARGAFIPAGNALDAYSAIGKVLGAASADALIVDPYMDGKALTEFAVLAPERVSVRLLSDERTHKPTLAPAAKRWTEQYGNERPLEVRLTPPRCLHDRLIVTDNNIAWTLTQSLNAFAARSPATIVRVDPETAQLKVAAYEKLWSDAKPL